MVKYFCDRCGQELGGDAPHHAKDIKVNNFTEMRMVCAVCLNSLKEWMMGNVVTPHDPLGETEEEAPPIPRHIVRRYRAVLEPNHPWLKKGIRLEVKEGKS